LTKTSWIVQTNVERESPTPALLREACAALELPFHGISVTRGDTSLSNLPDIVGPVVFHGRNTLVQGARAQARWRQGVFFSPENFHHDAYVAAYGSAMLNASARILTFEALMSEPVSASTKLFVRPQDDSKLFSGEILSFSQCRELYDALERATSDASAIRVVVAEPQDIDAEWRLFFVGGTVISGSMYRPSADRFVPPELIQFAEDEARSWTPAPVFVMDVARVMRSWKIVECNCFNGSRFYEANVEAVVDAVSSFQLNHWSQVFGSTLA
jgi:hypothetical protein